MNTQTHGSNTLLLSPWHTANFQLSWQIAGKSYPEKWLTSQTFCPREKGEQRQEQQWDLPRADRETQRLLAKLGYAENTCTLTCITPSFQPYLFPCRVIGERLDIMVWTLQCQRLELTSHKPISSARQKCQGKRERKEEDKVSRRMVWHDGLPRRKEFSQTKQGATATSTASNQSATHPDPILHRGMEACKHSSPLSSAGSSACWCGCRTEL